MRIATLSSPVESSLGTGRLTDTSVTFEVGLFRAAAGAAAADGVPAGAAATLVDGGGMDVFETDTAAVWGGPGIGKGVSLGALFDGAGGGPDSCRGFSSTSGCDGPAARGGAGSSDRA